MTQFWHAIRASAGNSFLWETCGPNVFRGDFHDSFALDLQVKDIRLFADMAKKAGVSSILKLTYSIEHRRPMHFYLQTVEVTKV